MDYYLTLILFSGLVIFSYMFEILARKIHIPPVLLLLISGLALKYILEAFGFISPDLTLSLTFLGTLGLILIVLEGALDLNYERSKRKMIIKAFFSALVIMLATAGLISYLFYFVTRAKYEYCLLNAIPFSVISSAIAIPSAVLLKKEDKEFIIYESTFSDILGILFFNLLIYNTGFGSGTFMMMGKDIFLTLIIAVVLCYLVAYLIKIVKHHVKFFLIISVIILVYSLSKIFHLSALIIVFVLGLFMNNIRNFKMPFLGKLKEDENFQKEISQMTLLTAESSFLVKTFFFLAFGFILDLQGMFNFRNIVIAVILLVIIYVIRNAYLYLFHRRKVIPEVYFSPRGLISILLLLSIPDEKRVSGLENGILFIIIIATSIIMTIGLISSRFISKTDEMRRK